MSAAPKITAVPEDDASLVARAAAGDERAFTAIYRKYARYVAGVAYRMMGDESELDDVVQETFVAASEGLSRIESGATLKHWLVTIAVRKVSRRLAKRQRQRWLAGWLGPTEPRVESPVVEGDVYALYRALAPISADRRVPWTLHALEGMTLPEVAAHCGISLATVKRRIAEAEALLAKRGHSVGGPRDGR